MSMRPNLATAVSTAACTLCSSPTALLTARVGPRLLVGGEGPGRVAQDVDASEPGDRGLDSGLHALLVADVHLHCQAGPSGRLDVGDDPFGAGAGQGRRTHGRTPPGP